ncbi:hypothetical protein B0H13DRAFT_2331444 [Mycena leptocephala]|nr:hypothetical protein B0H13DRAFT_2331444 [Mycena leptocephala]
MDFPFNLDPNSGKPLGVSWAQSTIGGGERSTSATGYLAPKFIQRPNLHVLLHAQVSRLVKVTRKKGKPSFGGENPSSSPMSQKRLSSLAARWQSADPHELGIGAHATLSALGIMTVLDLPVWAECLRPAVHDYTMGSELHRNL